jgi:hypothetical protein
MTTQRTSTLFVAAELYVNCGQQERNGRWSQEPTARYDCHRCGATEGPVAGVKPVRAFVEHVKAIHAGRCPAQTDASQ